MVKLIKAAGTMSNFFFEKPMSQEYRFRRIGEDSGALTC
jgi:hypothetical protein